MPKVSVIIPTYNRAHLVTLAIESVLSQTYQDFEIIVVDDGSRDNTQAIIESISDPKIRYLYQANQGPGAARNTGIRAATGQYVAFLDTDDLLLPEKLALQVEALGKQPELGLVAGGHLFVDEAGKPLAERRPWLSHPELSLTTWLYTCPITINAALVRREWLARAAGFDPALGGQAEDWDLWLRLAYLGCRMAWTPYIVCTYCLHREQRIRDGQSQKEAILALMDKFFAQPDLPAELRQERQRVYATAYLSGAFREYGANQVDVARQSLTQAIERAPALMRGDIPPLVYTLISWAVDPVTGDPATFVERVLDNLPASASRLRSLRQRMLYAAAIWTAVDANLVGNRALARQSLINVLKRDNSVVDNPSLVIELLVDYVRGKQPECQTKCIEDFFDNLPPQLTSLVSFRRKALGRLYIARGFEAHAVGAAKEAARAIWQGARLDPAWLRNRGVWSIMLRPLIGYSRLDRSKVQYLAGER